MHIKTITSITLLHASLQVSAFTAPASRVNNVAKSALNMAGPPYSGPATKPLLDSVEYPHDMNDMSIKDLKQVGLIFFISRTSRLFVLSDNFMRILIMFCFHSSFQMNFVGKFLRQFPKPEDILVHPLELLSSLLLFTTYSICQLIKLSGMLHISATHTKCLLEEDTFSEDSDSLVVFPDSVREKKVNMIHSVLDIHPPVSLLHKV